MSIGNAYFVLYYVECGILSIVVLCSVRYYVQYGILSSMVFLLWYCNLQYSVLRYFVRGILAVSILTHWYFDPGILSRNRVEGYACRTLGDLAREYFVDNKY